MLNFCLSVFIDPSNDLLSVCPGKTATLTCTVDPPRSGIEWSVQCQCSASRNESCRSVCNSVFPTFVNTGDLIQQGRVCASTEHITYSNNFSMVTVGADQIVSYSALSINIPLEPYRERNSMVLLCLECEYLSYRYLQVLSELIVLHKRPSL